jgi:GAF domain-containing protein
MTAVQETVGEELSHRLEELSGTINELNRLLDGFFINTGNMGVHPSIKLYQAKEKAGQDLEYVEQNSRKVIVQLDQLQALTRTAALITSSLELDEVLEAVMDTVVELTGAERAYLMLYQNNEDPEIRAARNWDKETIGDKDVRFSSSILRAAIDQGQPIITDNAQTDARFGGEASIVAQQLRSILCIPLKIRGRLVGVLYADNRFHKGIFKPEMLQLLTAFGTQAAIAIDNARRYGDVREGLAEAKREISMLRIAIDEAKRQQDVSKIVGSDSFKELRARAQAIRNRRLGLVRKSSTE